MRVLDINKLLSLADENKFKFNQSKPFKYVFMENFFSQDSVIFINKSFPDANSDVWKETNYKHTMKKSVLKNNTNELKELIITQDSRDILYELNSSVFLTFLQRLCGIDGLIGDPYLAEAGFHLSKGSSSLAIHSDFSHHDFLKLERRINFIYYLSPSYGDPLGLNDFTDNENVNLSLYSKDLKEREVIKIKSNSAVVFETFEYSYHGFPDPTNLAPGRFRRSLAMYYYSFPTNRQKHRIIFPEDPEFKYERGFGSSV